jgi:hypothetical protein
VFNAYEVNWIDNALRDAGYDAQTNPNVNFGNEFENVIAVREYKQLREKYI